MNKNNEKIQKKTHTERRKTQHKIIQYFFQGKKIQQINSKPNREQNAFIPFNMPSRAPHLQHASGYVPMTDEALPHSTVISIHGLRKKPD